MTPTPPPRLPNALSIDVDQWQRDVETFHEMTNSALRKIVADLSKQCTDGYATNNGAEDRSWSVPTERPALFESSVTETATSDLAMPQRAKSDGRLSKLEEELSRRLAGNRPAQLRSGESKE